MRVLLVEDTPRLAEAVAEILRKGGYGADVAHTGVDGLDLAFTGAYDVVLLDIMLPDMSGMEVLRELRAKGNSVPVILLTARQGVGDRVAGLDAGADDYLPKPFHASELLARIRAVMRRPQAYHADNVLEACGWCSILRRIRCPSAGTRPRLSPLTVRPRCPSPRITLTFPPSRSS